jgi:3,5-epimerase/4-reductase
LVAAGGCNIAGCLWFVLQILQLYKDYIDPDFTWSNFTVEEQAKVIVAPRSNNLLDTQRVRGCF